LVWSVHKPKWIERETIKPHTGNVCISGNTMVLLSYGTKSRKFVTRDGQVAGAVIFQSIVPGRDNRLYARLVASRSEEVEVGSLMGVYKVHFVVDVNFSILQPLRIMSTLFLTVPFDLIATKSQSPSRENGFLKALSTHVDRNHDARASNLLGSGHTPCLIKILSVIA
jgi:hypothetical protein